MRYLLAIACLIVLLLGFAINPQPVEGGICRQLGQQQVCIVDIQRSAKYYWQYRVTLEVDGQVRPREIYNCRDRVRISSQGDRIAFQDQSFGDLICRLVQR
ncbi:MAG: hypothetical protein ACLFV6_09685 [Spirulinaceae cyanobacterium]